jgi:hypothetical protein
MHNQLNNLACLRLDLGGLSDFACQLKDLLHFQGRCSHRALFIDFGMVSTC